MHAAKDDPNSSLPYASSLCGACFDACPVKIDIPSLLVELRHQNTEQAGTTPEKLAMKAAATVMRHPKLFTAAQKAAGLGRIVAGKDGTIGRVPAPFDGWSDSRDTPAPPKQTFRAWLASAEGAATLKAAADEGATTGAAAWWCRGRPGRSHPGGEVTTARDTVLGRVRDALALAPAPARSPSRAPTAPDASSPTPNGSPSSPTGSSTTGRGSTRAPRTGRRR